MICTPYLVIKKSSRRYEPSYRIVKSNPALDSDEIAIKLRIEIPDEIFSKPMLQASITVPKESVSAPTIDAETIDNVEELIKQGLGFSVKLQVINETEE